jgi:hypothetical protein
MEIEERKPRSALDSYLDWIIERHTATPRKDPEFLNYACRPLKCDSLNQKTRHGKPVPEPASISD